MSLNIDTSIIYSLIKDNEVNVSYLKTVTADVVASYTHDLDDILECIKRDVVDAEDAATTTLEKYLLELTNAIYFCGSKLENLGMYDTMSKAAYKEAYNNAYLGNQLKDSEKKNKTTVAENTAVAEQSTVNESAINTIYNAAYSIVKNKLQYAQLMVSSISKAISRRMSEMQLTTPNYVNGKQVLNESWQDQGY